jgi:transcription elongation factor GreA
LRLGNPEFRISGFGIKKVMEAVRKKLQTELNELEEELHFKLPKEIQKAREFGDLRENAEYKAAMERQSIVQARIMQVRQRLSEVDSIDVSKLPTDSAAYGSKVVLYDLDRDEDVTYKLVTSEESDPENGLISTVSPIGQSLMGKEEGDEVRVKTPNGWRNFEIKRLETIHDQGK